MTFGRWFSVALLAAAVVVGLALLFVWTGGRDQSDSGPVRALLEQMADDVWIPDPADPVWLALRPELEQALTEAPTGQLATLVRRAEARIELAASLPVWSEDGGGALLLRLDTRPRSTLGERVPYRVDVVASLDDGPSFRLARATNGGECEALVSRIAWPRELAHGFHHLAVAADIAFLADALTEEVGQCGFQLSEGALSGEPNESLPVETVLHRERRELPGVSFGLFDRRLEVTEPDHADLRTRGDLLDVTYDPFLPYAEQTLASAIEDDLPAVPFTDWLHDILSSRFPPPRIGRRVEWMTDFCNANEARRYLGDIGPTEFRPVSHARFGRRAVCATAMSGWVPIGMYIRVKVALLREDSAEWTVVPPEIYEAYLDTGGATLEIEPLAALPELLRLPLEAWPQADLRIEPADVSYWPVAPAPGDRVTVTVTIRNVGNLDVPYAHGVLSILPCCEEGAYINSNVAGAIPAGQSLIVHGTALLPMGTGWAGGCIQAYPPDGTRTIVDANRDDNCFSLEIGQPDAASGAEG